MDKKTVAVTVMTILIVVFLIAIGSTISAFKVSRERVVVSEIMIVYNDGVKVTNKDGESIGLLDVKSSAVGVRPATGDEDTETNIPTTVNDAVGTEGAYASFFLTCDTKWEIRLVSCSLTNGTEENLDNVRVAIMEEQNEPVCGEDVGSVLARGEQVNNKEYVIVVWLDQETTLSIKGSKISVVVEIVQII